MLLIDATVSGVSSPSEIRAWLARLQAMRQTYADDEQALRDIGCAEHEARIYLEFAKRQRIGIQRVPTTANGALSLRALESATRCPPRAAATAHRR